MLCWIPVALLSKLIVNPLDAGLTRHVVSKDVPVAEISSRIFLSCPQLALLEAPKLGTIDGGGFATRMFWTSPWIPTIRF